MNPDDVNLFVSDSSGGEEDVGYFPVVHEHDRATPPLQRVALIAVVLSSGTLLFMVVFLLAIMNGLL